MKLNKSQLKEGRPFEGLFSFHHSEVLPKESIPDFWAMQNVVINNDINFLLHKLPIKTPEVKVIAFALYNELYFGIKTDYSQMILSFTKHETKFIDIDRDMYFYFTQQFYKDIAANNLIVTYIIIKEVVYILEYVRSNMPPPVQGKKSGNKVVDHTVPEKVLDELEKLDLSPKASDQEQIQADKANEEVVKNISANSTSQTPISLSERVEEMFHKAQDEISKDMNLYKNFKNIMSESGQQAGTEDGQHELNVFIQLNQNINPGVIKSKIIKSFYKKLNRWINANEFGSTVIKRMEPLINAGEFTEILNPEVLAIPTMIEDLMVRTEKRTQMFDFYMDYSGSTNSRLNNELILDYFKMALISLLKKKEIRDCYCFDSKIVKQTRLKMMTIDPNGGTDINLVLQKIKKQQFPSIIITDLEDDINYYSPYAVFIIFNSNAAKCYNSFDSDSLAKYLKKKQLLVYETNNNRFVYPKYQRTSDTN